ncbi:hypothetical protein [Cellulosimicrobium sp. Marseille-Q4280]|uniref:hypothetical protein n=1 Tax=Cellulosimicrobium sp. Marseille-Q4280 TaxID=2937992 RepID=UPI002040238A|nr:hypothetical protein [Cellulosimicrobium sp. Marseille-Q4280]
MTPTLSELTDVVAGHLDRHPGSTTEQVLAVVAEHLTWYGQQDTFLVLALHRAGTRAGYGQDDDGLWYTGAQRPGLAAAFVARRTSPGARRLGQALEEVYRVGPEHISPDTERVLREALHFEAVSPAARTTDHEESP